MKLQSRVHVDLKSSVHMVEPERKQTSIWCALASQRWRLFLLGAAWSLALLGCNDSGAEAVSRRRSPLPPGEKQPFVLVSTIQADSKRQTEYSRNRRIQHSVVIGLNADMSSGCARGGEAIRRGVQLAVDEINARGGWLGRPVELVVLDHRGNPERGLDNIAEFADMEDLVAIVGGIHTPVVVRELDCIHKHQLLYLVPWAAGTPITSNGFEPNFVFRVSVRDEYAGGFLVDQVLGRGCERIGLILERTAWGRSNHRAMTDALVGHGKEPNHVEWFNVGATGFEKILRKQVQAGSDALLFVGSSLEGSGLVRGMAADPRFHAIPLISHWGITGGDFAANLADELNLVDLTILQTHSFLQPRYPKRSEQLVAAYCNSFAKGGGPESIFAPAGTAHAYEIVGMLDKAVQHIHSIDSIKLRDALENLDFYQGIMRDFEPPFTPEHHDALKEDDFILARYCPQGILVPVAGVE